MFARTRFLANPRLANCTQFRLVLSVCSRLCDDAPHTHILSGGWWFRENVLKIFGKYCQIEPNEFLHWHDWWHLQKRWPHTRFHSRHILPQRTWIVYYILRPIGSQFSCVFHNVFIRMLTKKHRMNDLWGRPQHGTTVWFAFRQRYNKISSDFCTIDVSTYLNRPLISFRVRLIMSSSRFGGYIKLGV